MRLLQSGLVGAQLSAVAEQKSALYSTARPLCALAAINPVGKCFWRYHSAAGMKATDMNY